jgi:hypothetical protein
MVEIKRLVDRGAVEEIAGTDQRAVNQCGLLTYRSSFGTSGPRADRATLIAIPKRCGGIDIIGTLPPNTVGTKSPTLRSSTFLSPRTVRISVPLRKQCSSRPFRSRWLRSRSSRSRRSSQSWSSRRKRSAETGVVLAIIADATTAPIRMRLRRELRSLVGGLSEVDMLLPPVLSARLYHGGSPIALNRSLRPDVTTSVENFHCND